MWVGGVVCGVTIPSTGVTTCFSHSGEMTSAILVDANVNECLFCDNLYFSITFPAMKCGNLCTVTIPPLSLADVLCVTHDST